MNEQKKDNN